MKKIASAMMAAALLTVGASPALAAAKAPSAQALSLKNAVRASSPSAKSSKLASSPGVSVALAALLIGGVIVASAAADNGDSGADSN